MIQKRMIAATLIFSMVIGLMSTGMTAFATQDTVLYELLDILSTQHLSGTSKDKLVDAAIAGAVQSLNDPYTEYFTDAEWNDFEDQLEQNYVGIGVRLEERKGQFQILEVFDNSPAKKAGIMVNDVIVTVNGASLVKLTIDQLMDKIKGAENTSVKIGVMRGTKKFVYDMKRQKVQNPVVTNAKYGDIGYLSVSSFSTDAGVQFGMQLKKLEQSKIKGLVIDLRNNGGGILEVARQIASNFISKGVLIYTRDRNNKKSPMPIENGTTKTYPVTILVNEWSASCSEVLSGALKDYNIAKLVGKKTFGKGSVQDVVQLDNGGILKVTANEYLTPKQHKVNKIGLTPDLLLEGTTAQLVGALRLAGSKTITLHFDNPEQFTVNNIQQVEVFDLYDTDRPNFVQAELLSAMSGVNLSADATNKQLYYSLFGGPKVALPKWSVEYKNNSWYVDWSSLAGKFTNLKWRKTNGAWELTYQKAS